MAGRNFEVYRKTWKTNALPPLAEPFLYLMAFGLGLGALIETVAGLPYVVFIAPGIIAITMMQTAFMETTYSSYVRMWFQKTWDAVLATPLSPREVLWGEVVWAAFRATINASLMSIVVWVVLFLQGHSMSATALAIPLVAAIVGLMFAGLGLFVTAKVRVIDQFSYSFFLFITPQFLFAGTFFPLEQLPVWARSIAFALPLTHAVGLARGVFLGIMGDLFWIHIAYLLVAAVVFNMIAIRACEKRIVQ